MTHQANTHPTKGQSMRVKLSIFCVLAGLSLGIAASPALAVRGHVPGVHFGEPGSGDGQLSEPEGVAVNESSGDVYVVDKGNSRVEVFKPRLGPKGEVLADEFVAVWGWGVENGKPEYQVCTSSCQAGVAGTGEGQFFWYSAGAVTVDNACQLQGLTEASSPKTCKEFDPSDGDVYVTTGEFTQEVVDKFSSAGVFLGRVTGPVFPELGTLANPEPEGITIQGVAVDPRGELWVATGETGETTEHVKYNGADNFTNALVNKFVAFRHELGPYSFADGLAVDGSDELYVRLEGNSEARGPVAEFDSHREELTGGGEGLVGPTNEGVGFNGVAVEAATGDVYLDHVTNVERLGAFAESGGGNQELERFGAGRLPGEGCGSGTSTAEEELSCRGGIGVSSATGRVYVVVASQADVQEFVLEPPAAPVVQGESVSEVTSASVRFAGEVNPRSEPFEAATSYWFEYTTVAQFAREGWTGAASTPTAQLAPSYVLGAVSAPVTGLAPGTSYRYRLVAENALGVTRGEVNGHSEELPRVLTTQPVGESGLLDGRGYELVSPPDKLGAFIEPLVRFAYYAVQAAAGGDGLTYYATAPTEATPPGNAGITQVLSSRDGTGGWATRDLVVPHSQATALTEHPEWPLFSGDLARAAVQPLGPFDQGLSPLGSEQTAYSYDDFEGGGASGEPCASSCYTPLVSGANTPEGTVFGVNEEGAPNTGSEECPPDPFCGPQFVAASPDLEHVVVHSRVALTPSTEGLSGIEKLFEVSAGGLVFVGEGEVGDGSTGESDLVSAGSHSVSVDGSRVVFRGSAAGKSGLLLRDTVTGEVVRLAAGAVFLGASSDDSRVFFTGATGALEECEIVVGESGELQCNESGKPLDLTPGATVLTPLAGVSEDGSSVYFISRTVLTGTEKDPGGEEAVNGQPNLYVYHEGATRLVAVLSSEDISDWGNGEHFDGRPASALTELTARVSPDGGWLAFVSERALTGYDNTQAQHGECEGTIGHAELHESGACREVFLYHAPTAGQPASVVCASCDPTGVRPSGGASVPGWTNGLYQSRYLSDGGRLFFDSPDGLVPQDTNKVGDVYEYEPVVGAGGVEPGEAPPGDSCTTASLVYHASSGGCVDLVSSGTSSEPSSFLDASETGGDVFFLTTAQISKRDTDTSFDVYDASVGGSEPEPVKPVECQGDACQTPVAAPEDPAQVFQGLGNFPAPLVSTAKRVTKKTVKCKKPKKLSHNKCVRPKTKKRKAKKTNRRASR